MYENIVVFCVIFSKMSYENGNMFYTYVHTCGKMSTTPEVVTKGFGNKLYLDK